MGRWYRWVLVGVVTAGCGSEAPAGGAVPGGEAAGAAASTPGGHGWLGGDAKAESPRCPEPRVPLAQRMGVKMAEICEKAAVDPMQVDGALDLSLSGAWKGEYVSDGLGSSPTRFDANLFVSGGSVSGTTSEPNTFGPYGYAELAADVNGEAYATRQVVLLKTYRTATITHSVLYVGRLDEAGKRIEGRWRLGGGQGTFWMERGT
jgi:hypothetical protein